MNDELEEHVNKLEEEGDPLLCPYCEGGISEGDETLADENGVFHHRGCLEQKLDLDHTEDLVERRNKGHNTLDSAFRFQNGSNPW